MKFLKMKLRLLIKFITLMVKQPMSLPNYNIYQKYSRYFPLLIIAVAVLLTFAPIFRGKIPLNTRNLVSFFSPWYYEKFDGFPAGVPGRPGILDQLRIYYPYMRLTQDAYRHGELPLWNPFNFAGNPHMAEWQSGVFTRFIFYCPYCLCRFIGPCFS